MKFASKKNVIYFLIAVAASCTSTPIVVPSGQTAATNGSLGPTETQPPTATETIAETATITPTPTKVPDVELAQLQNDYTFFFSEIVNHLDVPVVFEDQQPAFHFDVYDPLLDKHFVGDEPVDRYDSSTIVPCVIYPGETAFFFGGARALGQWYEISNSSPYQSLQIGYQSLGTPRPDWKEKGMHYEIRDLKWRLDGNVLYFSFRHDPFTIKYGGDYYFNGTMGLYDKDNHLLGVGYGNQHDSMETGIAEDYWISLDLRTPGINNRKEWIYAELDDIKERLDHIRVLLEVIPEVDGVCRKRVPTDTP